MRMRQVREEDRGLRLGRRKSNSKARQLFLQQLQVREVGIGRKLLNTASHFKAIQDNKTVTIGQFLPISNNDDGQPSAKNFKREEDERVIRARQRLAERMKTKKQIAADLKQIEQLQQEQRSEKSQAMAKVVQKERAKRFVKLTNWQENRARENQQRLDQERAARTKQLKELSQGLQQRQSKHCEYLRDAALKFKNSVKHKSETARKATEVKTTKRKQLLGFAEQVQQLRKPKRAGRTIPKRFRSDKEIERLARDIVTKASLNGKVSNYGIDHLMQHNAKEPSQYTGLSPTDEEIVANAIREVKASEQESIPPKLYSSASEMSFESADYTFETKPILTQESADQWLAAT